MSDAAIRRYWDDRPCGSSLANAPAGTPEFFRSVELARYQLDVMIHDIINFPSWRDKRVLEIGCGLGTDFAQFCCHEADAHAIDLSPASVDLARRRLSLDGLRGTISVGHATTLPYGGASFDLVYSWGVLHHIPDIRAAFGEIHRVLVPRGRFIVMLYHRRSWVALWAHLRWGLLRGHPLSSLPELLAKNLESPGTRAYTALEVQTLLSSFDDVVIRPYLTAYDRLVPLRRRARLLDILFPDAFLRLLGDRFGWYLVATGRKP